VFNLLNFRENQDAPPAFALQDFQAWLWLRERWHEGYFDPGMFRSP
jgi:hypothetical protein